MPEFCGVEFEPGCVDFHETLRTVHTASSEKVRRPITRGGPWSPHEPRLGRLKDALGLPQ